MKSKINAVAYARFSSDNQREESIDAQIKAVNKYANLNGYNLIFEYVDEAQSGTSDKRVSFQQMMLDAQRKKFDAIIVHKMDRFARNVADHLKYKELLTMLNIKIISVIEQFDDTPEGEMFELFQMGINQYYSRNLARETMKGLIENAERCVHNGGTPPLGYDVDPITRKYIINEHEAEIVKLIFSEVINGKSYVDIANLLNNRGYKTKVGSDFTPAFYDILVNRKYIGEYIFNRTSRKTTLGKSYHRRSKDESDIVRIKGGMPAIIAEELFNKVGEILKYRKNNKGMLKANDMYYLSGLVICSHCESKFYANARVAGRNKEKYMTYRCSKKTELSCNCDVKEINKTYLDNYVIHQLLEKVLSEKHLTFIENKINQYNLKESSVSSKEKEELESKIDKVNETIDSLIQAISYSKDKALIRLTQEIDKYETEKELLVRQLQTINQSSKNVQTSRVKIKDVMKKVRLYIDNQEGEGIRDVLRKFVKAVTVSNNTIKIEFKLNEFLIYDIDDCLTFEVKSNREKVTDKRQHQFKMIAV